MSQNRVKIVDVPTFKTLIRQAEAKCGAQNPEAVMKAVGNVAVVKGATTEIVAKEIDRENRIIPFKISDASVDREGDTIAVDGWDLNNYNRNPVVLFGHDHYQPSVAKSLATYVEGNALKSRAQFPSREVYEFGYTIFQLYAEGYMRATSVGFIPKNWNHAEESDDRKGGYDFTKQEMLEYSCVPVPANPEALIEARTVKGIDVEPLRKWAARVMDETADLRRTRDRVHLERLYAVTDTRGVKMVDMLGVVKFPDPVTSKDDDVVIHLADDDTPIGPASGYDDSEQHEQAPHTPETPSDPAELPLHDPDSPEATWTEPNPDANPSDPGIGEDAGKTNEDGTKGLPFFGGEDAPDPIRWNKSLSKRFDVDRAQFQPATAEYALASGFIGCEVKRLTERDTVIPSAKVGTFLTSLNETLVEASVVDIRNLDKDGKEYPPQHEIIQLNSRQRSEFLVDGIRFIEWRGHKMTVRVAPTWYGLNVRMFSERGDGSDLAQTFLDETLGRMSKYKFLQGEAFSLSGEFLERGTEALDGTAFLSERNGRGVQRVIDLVNAKGKEMDSRGMMMVGPPGTGKTLSSRVMMNQCKSTFIWISSRDLARSGAFGGISYALQVAREHAPAVVLMEDIDNWLDSWTIDMLKTEMDGLKQYKGVVTILTTNFPELMPKALIDRPGRFHDILRFDLPDAATRTKMVKAWMPELTVAEDVALVVRETEGYSGAHIRDLARYAETIREQDGVTVSASLVAAIAKMKEQRDIINGTQAAGSRYRAPSFVMNRADFGSSALVTLHGAKAVVESGPRESFLKAFEELGAGSTVEHVRVGDVEKTIVSPLDPVLRRLFEVRSKLAAEQKAGRVLSSKNENTLKEVDQMIASASEKLSTVLSQVAQPEAEEQETDAKALVPAKDEGIVIELADDPADDTFEIDGEIDLSVIASVTRAVLEERVMMMTGRVDLS